MLSMLSNISLDKGHNFDYDYQLIAGGFLFAQWGDVLNLETESFEPGNGALLAYNSPDGFPSGQYDTLILTDNWDTIPGGWGNTSQYLARFSNYMFSQNPNSQTYFYQNWPSLRDENLSAWRAQIDTDWPTWQQVADTVNGDADVSTVSDSLFYIPEDERLSAQAKRVKMIPAGLALARLYDEYQRGNLPPNGRSFISEAFKYPDLTLRANETLDGTDVIGHLSPEGEYYIALVVYASIYGLTPENATNDITFNQRGWSGYGLNLFPQTPYPNPAIIEPSKALYYQELAWQVVTQFYGWSETSSGGDENTDSDGDGVIDGIDAFPFDETESVDSDGDGVGDNGDAFPNDPNESTDTDGDGIGDNADLTPNGGDETSVPQVKLTFISFVNFERNENDIYVYWGTGEAIRFRILLMSHNQAPITFMTTDNEYTFTDVSVFDGISTLMIEGFDSLGNSIFSRAYSVEDL